MGISTSSPANSDQTQKQFFNAYNAFDAEGLTRLTESTQRRTQERNEIEQNTQVAIGSEARP
jgi:uncharacterized membrane protein YqiK